MHRWKIKAFLLTFVLHTKNIERFQFRVFCYRLMRREKERERKGDCATIFYVVHLLFSLVCRKIEKTCSPKKKLLPYLFRFTSLAHEFSLAISALCDNVFPQKTLFSRKIAFTSRLTVVGCVVKSDEMKRCLCLNIYVEIANSLSDKAVHVAGSR